MASDTGARAHEIFTRALRLDAGERDALAREACLGDEALLERVRRLLRAADRSAGFLETPALASHSLESAPASQPDAVGNYLVVGVLGAGGMATVYEAVQENPHRRVAIKVMRQSVTSPEALLRFRLEAQTLARLRHPGIAQIYEAGAAPLGQPTPSPFFAMELVPEALPITRYARERRLPLRERLEIFASVCDAALHGHQNGVIHRDIKPANVLVGPDGRAKLIDFGIARSAERGAPSITGDSDARRLIGSLQSMSPEQCADPTSIDVRSDVYSLGALLYELVTDRPAHNLAQCSIPQAVRIIAEVDPARAGSIAPQARGDLEAIIAKAMEKDRERRYAGAAALAADVRRFLSNQPIEARRSTMPEQVRKFARRNPPLAVAIAAAVALLVTGVVVSSWFAYDAARARDAALRRERALEVVTDFQESMLKGIDVTAMGDGLRREIGASLRESARAESGEAGASAAIAEWERLAARLNFTTLAVGSLNTNVLERYAAGIRERFKDEPALRGRLLQRLADTMNTLGLHEAALPVITEAFTVRRGTLGADDEDTLQSQHSLGSLLTTLGKYDEALPHLAGAYEGRRRTLGPDHRATLGAGTSLGGLHRRMGNLAECERIWTDTLARQRQVLGDDDPSTLRTINNIGVLYAVQGRLDKAEVAWRELLERRRRLVGEDHPDYRGSLANLGALLQLRGRYDEAEPLLRESLESERRNRGDTHTATLASMSMLASLLRETGNLAEAEALGRECLAGREAALGPEHPDTLVIKSELGATLHARGATSEGERLALEALEIQRRTLGEAHPETLATLATVRDIERDTGRTGAALERSERVVALSRGNARVEPYRIGGHLSVLGSLLAGVGRFTEAKAALHEGYGLLETSLGAAHPETRAAAARLAAYYAQAEGREPGAALAQERAKWERLSAGETP